MTTQPLNHNLNQPEFPRVTIWGIILLMLGGPSFLTVQKRSADATRPVSLAHCAVAVLLASILVSTIELSLL